MAEDRQDFVADYDIWVTADYSKVVDAGSPDAAHILAHTGQVVEHEGAVRLGLMPATKDDKKAANTGGSGGAATGDKAGTTK